MVYVGFRDFDSVVKYLNGDMDQGSTTAKYADNALHSGANRDSTQILCKKRRGLM